jgi:alcohol dehydrogenase class IV
LNKSVKDYLEGVGTATHPGTKVPFIAIPTTSGTGSEATKNAVISETGEHGYKRSLRHNNFVPDLAIVDPLLTVGCPPGITASSGMDAFTQLLESFLSTAANPVTDALALEGLRRISKALRASFHQGSDIVARADMALASYLSGLTLANAGLGLVHGLAGPIGGFFDAPHGVICSNLMAPSNRVTVRKLRSTRAHAVILRKYAIAGRIFSGEINRSEDYYTDEFLELMQTWTEAMNIPPLSRYGVTADKFEKIADNADAKNNPVSLNKEEMIEVLAGLR